MAESSAFTGKDLIRVELMHPSLVRMPDLDTGFVLGHVEHMVY